MARKRKELPELKNIEITGVAAEGKALTKIQLDPQRPEQLVVFIPYAAPGDIVNIKIDKKKHSFAEAHITELINPSPIREEPRCEYFTTCGGCKWQHLPYSSQLEYKRQHVIDCLQRIAKVKLPEIPPTLGSDNIWEYRNKMEYTFSNKRWKSWEEMKGESTENSISDALGFHIPGSFDKVLHINDCSLQNSLGNNIRNFIYKYALENNLSFYDIKNQKGFLRNLMIRIASTGETMVCVVFGEKDKNQINNLLEAIATQFPDLTDIEYVINLKLNDSIADQEVLTYKGKGFIEEKMNDLTFRISPKSFFQTNTMQAIRLYETVADFAGLREPHTGNKPLVFDLYTGTGTIANFVASNASKVIGIEYVEDAIKDAKINSEINGISNTEFYAGDMKDVLNEEFIKQHGVPDVMIVDPPRAGMHEDVVKTLLVASPQTIVYVSCNPATQARDLALLDSCYEVERVQPVDMFPHTHHIENVVKLTKRQS